MIHKSIKKKRKKNIPRWPFRENYLNRSIYNNLNPIYAFKEDHSRISVPRMYISSN